MLPWKNTHNGDIAVYSSLLRLGIVYIWGWIILWLGMGSFPEYHKMFNNNRDLYTLDPNGDKHECLQTLPTGRKNHPRLRTAKSMESKTVRITQGAQGWCIGMTLRDGMGREVEEGFGMGDTCTPMADSCQYMAKNHHNIVQ